MESDAFKSFLASGIVDLRLYITTRLSKYGRFCPFNYYDKHELFNQMPKTWLALPLATNLRVLSLYCYEYWGWHPKMDFRAAGGGRGFPNLNILALGKYVCSHEWQAEWFVFLGKQELYLDDCRIVYQSRTWWTPDNRTTVAG
ncbi:hypothetical protein QQZ08_003459 [Neonectria magnoliae]|uniref:Uncharacterized protein n=1 Tax=Neonectria magnoliae TaxID=2732573 RepID=A0ABR1IB47_9HYPO